VFPKDPSQSTIAVPSKAFLHQDRFRG
jgi:hypothetical protein